MHVILQFLLSLLVSLFHVTIFRIFFGVVYFGCLFTVARFSFGFVLLPFHHAWFCFTIIWFLTLWWLITCIYDLQCGPLKLFCAHPVADLSRVYENVDVSMSCFPEFVSPCNGEQKAGCCPCCWWWCCCCGCFPCPQEQPTHSTGFYHSTVFSQLLMTSTWGVAFSLWYNNLTSSAVYEILVMCFWLEILAKRRTIVSCKPNAH